MYPRTFEWRAFPKTLEGFKFYFTPPRPSSTGLRLGAPPGDWFLTHLAPCLTTLSDNILSAASLDLRGRSRIFIGGCKVGRTQNLFSREPRVPHRPAIDEGLARWRFISEVPFQMLTKRYDHHPFCRFEDLKKYIMWPNNYNCMTEDALEKL